MKVNGTAVSQSINYNESYNNQKISRLALFVLASILFHSSIIYYVNFEIDFQKLNPLTNELKFNTKLLPNSHQTQKQNKITKPTKTPQEEIETPVNVKKPPEQIIEKTINAQQLINNSYEYFVTQRKNGLESQTRQSFDFPKSDGRTKEKTKKPDQQFIEPYKLANGNSALIFPSIFGTDLCTEIQNADPLDELSVSMWYV